MRFPQPLRRAKEWADYAASDHPLLPPPWLHSVGSAGDFRAVGEEFLRHFIDLGDLKPSGRVLDVGCGTGRMAAPLTTYLTTGTYDGFDVVGRSIRWCRKAYRPFPNFRFHHADLSNPRYNAGVMAAEEYRFPFADASFDFAFLASVLTHLLTSDAEHYLSEIRRVLAPGGRALVTIFALDDETRRFIAARKAHHSFRHLMDGCAVDDANLPEAAVAYDAADFRQMVASAGLSISSVHKGMWRGTSGLSWQDIYLLIAP